MQIIQTDRAPAAIGPYSQAICTGGMVYTSGQIPLNPATGAAPEGVEAQSRQALENLAAVLAASTGWSRPPVFWPIWAISPSSIRFMRNTSAHPVRPAAVWP